MSKIIIAILVFLTIFGRTEAQINNFDFGFPIGTFEEPTQETETVKDFLRVIPEVAKV